MIDLPYSLVIEATEDPAYFSFYSEELIGFTGSAGSLEERLNSAKSGMIEHLQMLSETGREAPEPNADPVVLIRNERRGAA